MFRHACVLIDAIRLHSDLHILSRWSSKHWNERHLAPDRCEKGHFCLCYEPWFSEGIPGKCELCYSAPFPSLLLLPPTHTLLHTPRSIPSHSYTLYSLLSPWACSRSLTSLVNTHTPHSLDYTEGNFTHSTPEEKASLTGKTCIHTDQHGE